MDQWRLAHEVYRFGQPEGLRARAQRLTALSRAMGLGATGHDQQRVQAARQVAMRFERELRATPELQIPRVHDDRPLYRQAEARARARQRTGRERRERGDARTDEAQALAAHAGGET